MSVYCQFYDNKQNKISEVIVSNASISIPANAVSGLFYDNTYKLDGLKLTLNNLTANDFSFDFAKDYFLYVFPAGYSSILATSVRSSSLMSGVPELSQNDIDYLKNLSDNSQVDLSTIVTALNSITSALSALTNLSNLSNLADLANIITAITNKNNQSDIVDELRYLFSQSVGENSYRYLNNNYNLSLFKGNYSSASFSSLSNTSRASFAQLFRNLNAKFSLENNNITSADVPNNSKFLNLLVDKLNNIEIKLEQNLPFTTVVENEIVETNVSQNCSYGSKIEQIPFSE